MRRSNIVEALMSSGLFETCRHPAVMELLASHGSFAHYGCGSIVPAADSWPDFHVLVEGSVQVVHYAESGREVRLCDFTGGQAFGGFDLTGDSRIAVHMIAKTDSTAIRFAGWTVFDAARADPEDLGLDLLRGATFIVAHLSRSLVDLTVERARDRVRLELVRQARRNMVDGQTGVIEPAPTHADLAAQVGSHREEVTREMSYLRQRSLVKRAGRRLLVRVRAVEDLYQRERPGGK